MTTYPMADVAKFGALMVESHDLDPLYPILRRVHEDYDLTPEEALWHTVLYLAYYQGPPAHAVWLHAREPGDGLPEWAWRLPTGIERRGLRDPDMKRRHIENYTDITGHETVEWWTHDFGPDWIHNWRILFARTQEVFANGRWAAYKFGDLARYVLGWPVEAPDTGMQHSTGPREGICVIYGIDDPGDQDVDTVAWFESQAFHLQTDLAQHGTHLAIDQVETILCDFKSLTRGRYYVGHDIDLHLEDVHKAVNDERIPRHIATRLHEDMYRARHEAIPTRYLGELHGWTGRSKLLQKAYRMDKHIITRPDFEGVVT